MLHEAGLNSLPNGRSSASSWAGRSSRNGSILTINGGINGIHENGGRSPGPPNGVVRTSNGDRSSTASTNGNGHTKTSTETTSQIPTTNGDVEPLKRVSIPAPISTNPGSTGPLTYSSSVLPATPQSNETPAKAATTSTHRFSSPPAYPLAHSTTATPLTHPGSAQLQHRHTLQVPKVGTGRSSRDGDDAIYSSGRFSPTSVAASARRGSLNLNRRNTQSIHSNMPHEEIPQDEDAMRWSEAVRQKRASKRRRKDEEEDDRVVMGTKVDQNHVNWVTAYNMLTGIRFTVSRTNAKMDRPLTEADFEAKHKFSFDM